MFFKVVKVTFTAVNVVYLGECSMQVEKNMYTIVG